MEKEEILARTHGKGPDEREQKIFLDAYNFAGSVSILVCMGLVIYSMVRDESFYQYSLLIFATLSANRLYRYAKLRRRGHLVVGLICLVCAIVFGVLFFLGW